VSEEKIGISLLLRSVVRELSITGRFAAFFGVGLIVWDVTGLQPAKIYSGLALVFFAFANASWRDRHVGVYYTGEVLPWYRDIIWSKVFWAVIFLSVAIAFAVIWLRLHDVHAFLTKSGIPL